MWFHKKYVDTPGSQFKASFVHHGCTPPILYVLWAWMKTLTKVTPNLWHAPKLGRYKMTKFEEKCPICLDDEVPILAENIACGHRLCKSCAIKMEHGDKALQMRDMMEMICLTLSGVCPMCCKSGKYKNVATDEDLCPERKTMPLGWIDEYSIIGQDP
jgi:hypothetical protein